MSGCLFLKCLLYYSTKNIVTRLVAVYTTESGIVFLVGCPYL